MGQCSGRRVRLHRQAGPGLPLQGYVLFVGGALLSLLLVADAVLPKPANSRFASRSNIPTIRIHSEFKLPPPVLIDTSQRMLVPVTLAPAVEAETASLVETVSSTRESAGQIQLEISAYRQSGAVAPQSPERASQRKRKRFKSRHKRQRLYIGRPANFGWFETMKW